MARSHARIGSVGQSIRREADSVLGALTDLSALPDAIAEASALLPNPSASDMSSLVHLGERFPDLYARYTMQQERIVHDAFFGQIMPNLRNAA